MRSDRWSVAVTPLVALLGAGLAWAGSQGGVAVAGVPLFALCVAMAFAIQWVAFVPAWARQTERDYDITGSLTYVATVSAALVLGGSFDLRSLLLWGLVVIWAGRLGSFLYARVRRAGRDSRFDTIKTSFVRFLNAWTLQGLWVSLTAAAALAAITSERAVGASAEAAGAVDAFTVVGLITWLSGFALEVVADEQKRRFRADPANAGRFISSGVWAWSRHPNYFGEIVLWTGIAIIAYPVLAGWQYVTLASPLFVYVLLTRISGIPLLERTADRTWGGQPDYEDYKARTPVLVPRPPR